MKAVKAIALREPFASRIAAGEETTAYKNFRTGHRGQILIVSDQEPWYALALAELVEVRPISPAMNAPINRGYAWTFANIVSITRFPVAHRTGLFTAEIPEGALPSALQMPALSTQPPSRPDDDSVKVAVAKELRMARAGMRIATRGLGELVAQRPASGDQPDTLKRFEAAAAAILSRTEELISDMVRLDDVWRRELAPRSMDDDVIAAELGVS